jgi:hypothetical protein
VFSEQFECRLHWAIRRDGRRIELRFAEVQGRLVCIGLEIGPARDAENFRNVEDDDLKPLTATEIRLPLKHLIDFTLERAGMSWTPTPGVPLYDELSQKLAMLDTAKAEKKRAGRPLLYGPEHFAEVAAVYRKHEADGGRAPTKAVKDHFGVTKSTAAKWVARAREMDLLDEYQSRLEP